ncbi:MAG: glucosyltransferase domain-containing protein [Tannerella sp.]|jgi:hypothetical protein|nr:glucosyltransferase domain-containing protein [Tannerella sp.]
MGQMIGRDIVLIQGWLKTLQTYALGGIFLILSIDFFILTKTGRQIVNDVKSELKECLSSIDFHSFIKPTMFMAGIYLLGAFSIIRANFLYMDDIGHALEGYRGWYNWSRYVTELLAIIIHADFKLSDISPLPQLIACLMLAISSVLLVYTIGRGKITYIGLLASIPLGLSPYFLECLSYKFDAPYMAISILASIVPFLFVTRRKAFFLVSVISLLIMCMTYQAASGIYMLVAVFISYNDWNSRLKTNRENFSLLGFAVLSFFVAMLLFKFLLTRSTDLDGFYVSTAIHPLPHLLSGIWLNLVKYITVINNDLSFLWKAGIILICILFIIKTVNTGKQPKILSLVISVLLIVLLFIVSYGVYYLFATPLFHPRALYGFGVFLSILFVYTVYDFKRIASIIVLAFNWSMFVFAFTYGNALADQGRYADFRIGIIMQDINKLYPDRNDESLPYQLKNTIDFAPTIGNIAKHYPIIERLVPRRLGFTGNDWEFRYFQDYFNGHLYFDYSADYNTLEWPIIIDSYYQTIKSDGKRCYIILKH